MPPHSKEFYHAAIKNAFSDAWDVRKPIVPGGVSPVFLCDTPSGTKVCRFSEYEIVFRNRHVSDILNLYNIPAPHARVHTYLDTWFELYNPGHVGTADGDAATRTESRLEAQLWGHACPFLSSVVSASACPLNSSLKAKEVTRVPLSRLLEVFTLPVSAF